MWCLASGYILGSIRLFGLRWPFSNIGRHREENDQLFLNLGLKCRASLRGEIAFIWRFSRIRAKYQYAAPQYTFSSPNLSTKLKIQIYILFSPTRRRQPMWFPFAFISKGPRDILAILRYIDSIQRCSLANVILKSNGPALWLIPDCSSPDSLMRPCRRSGSVAKDSGPVEADQ